MESRSSSWSSSSPMLSIPSAGSGSASICYDVLAIVDAMEAVGVAEDAVYNASNAIGHLPLASLAALRSCGLTRKEVTMVRRRLTRLGVTPITVTESLTVVRERRVPPSSSPQRLV